MRHLIQTTEIYRADTEKEAQDIINEAKNASEYILTKYSSEQKDIKEKREVVGEYYKISLTKVFTDIKDPIGCVNVVYEVD